VLSEPIRASRPRGARRPRAASLAAAIAAACALAGLTAGARARAAAGPYVALGDSYTAAPLVGLPSASPILCGRSTANYPSLVARAIHPSAFLDESCAGAATIGPRLLWPAS